MSIVVSPGKFTISCDHCEKTYEDTTNMLKQPWAELAIREPELNRQTNWIICGECRHLVEVGLKRGEVSQ